MSRRKKHSRKKAFNQRNAVRRKSGLVYSAKSQKLSLKEYFYAGRLYIVVSVILVIGLIYLLFFYPFFFIGQVIAENNTLVTEEQLKEVVNKTAEGNKFLIFPKRNILLFDIAKLESEITQTYPEIAQVAIEKEFPNNIRIAVKERTTKAIWMQNDKLFYLASDGVILGEAPPEGSEDLVKIQNEHQEDAQAGNEITSAKIIRFAENIDKAIQLNTDLVVKNYSLPSSHASELHAILENQTQIYFSVEKSPESQIAILKTIIDEELGGEVEGLEYIDLRVGNWVYYK